MRGIFGKRIALPPHVRSSLAAIFGASSTPVIDEVRIIERSLFARLHGRAVATTRRRRIFLRGSAAEFFGDASLMLHEYCHVLRQWEPGALTTLRYVREWVRRGYWNNRFEVEARAFAREHEGRFCQMLLAAQTEADGMPERRSATHRNRRVHLGTQAPRPDRS